MCFNCWIYVHSNLKCPYIKGNAEKEVDQAKGSVEKEGEKEVHKPVDINQKILSTYGP